jgi:hypothetical protein
LLGLDQGHAFDILPISQWERLVITASLLGRNQWLKAPLYVVIKCIREALGSVGQGWIISGSTAMKINGLKVVPNDIDIWCTKECLQQIAEVVRQRIERINIGRFTAERVVWTIHGWSIEAVGPLVNDQAASIALDDPMLCRAFNRVESPEDVISELLVLRREEKRDVSRAGSYISELKGRLDVDYMKWRLVQWGGTTEIFEALLLEC